MISSNNELVKIKDDNKYLIENDEKSEKNIDVKNLIPETKIKNTKNKKNDLIVENKVRSKISVIIFGLIISSGGLYMGFGLGQYNSFFKPFIEKIHGIYEESNQISIQGNLGLIFEAGGAACALTGNLIYQKVGRFRALIFGYIFSIIICLISLINNIWILYIVRLFQGYIACFYTLLCPLYVFEVIIPKYSKILTNSFYFFLTTGILLSYSFGEATAEYWRVVFMIPAFLAIPKLIIVLIFYRMESPIYLYESYNKSDLDLNLIITKNYRFFYKKNEALEVTNNFINTRNKLTVSSKKKVLFKDLFTKDYSLQVFMGFFLNFINQATGVNVLIFYSSKIYEQLELENIELLTFMFGLINVISSIFNIIFSGKMGKKIPYIIGLISQGIGLFIFAFGAEYSKGSLVIFGGYLFMFTYGSSCGGLIYPYITDFMPPVGIPIVALSQWILALIIVKFSVPAIKFFGEFAIFLFFSISAFLSAFVIWGFGIETTDKTPEEVYNLFKNKKFGRKVQK